MKSEKTKRQPLQIIKLWHIIDLTRCVLAKIPLLKLLLLHQIHKRNAYSS